MLFVKYMLRIDHRALEKLFENAGGRIHMGGRTMDACIFNQRTNGPVNAHLISKLSKAQNTHNLENIW